MHQRAEHHRDHSLQRVPAERPDCESGRRVHANELIKGLTDAGAAEAALRVVETMQDYGHGERPLREYAQELKPTRAS